MICGHSVDAHFYKEIQGKFTKSLKIIIIVSAKKMAPGYPVCNAAMF